MSAGTGGKKNSQMCQLLNKPRDTDRQINREMHLIDAHREREINTSPTDS